jgi:transcription termination/antitermination protein NusA
MELKLSPIIDELVSEKGMNKGDIIDSLSEIIESIYRKKFPEVNFVLKYDKSTDNLSVMANKKVVSKVKDKNTEINLRIAQSIHENTKIGKFIAIMFDKTIGRIDILKARLLIGQKIKVLETESICKEFEDKKGSLISGTVKKVSESGVYVTIHDFYAFLPKSLNIPEESIASNTPIRAIIKDITSDPQKEEKIILERISINFVRKLLESEIPEVYEKIINIENIARIPGYKTKVLVSSNISDVNAVGTCIGPFGARIKQVLRELGGEKLDIIKYSENKEELVANALKPAKVDHVEIRNGIARATVSEKEKPSAIGRLGRNIMLASKIAGMQIEVIVSKKNNIFADSENSSSSKTDGISEKK